MAPTVCMTDFPETGNPHLCERRRQRIQDRSINKRQKVEFKKLSSKTSEIQEMILLHPLSPISRPRCPTDSYVPIILRSSRKLSTVLPSEQDNQWKMALRRDGLLDIFIRTIALVRRNHILQKRVNALREETQDFISSMMTGNDSQNEEEDISIKENSQVSSTTENNSRSSSPSVLDSRTNSESNRVSSSSEVVRTEDLKC